MYPSLKEDLQAILEALNTNAKADWTENDPADEFETLATQLEAAINKSRSREDQVERLSHYTCGMDAEGEYVDTDVLLDALLKQAEEDGTVNADDVVTMWEPLESRYTVNDLLEMIGAI
jgi:hypothetical protein